MSRKVLNPKSQCLFIIFLNLFFTFRFLFSFNLFFIFALIISSIIVHIIIETNKAREHTRKETIEQPKAKNSGIRKTTGSQIQKGKQLCYCYY